MLSVCFRRSHILLAAGIPEKKSIRELFQGCEQGLQSAYEWLQWEGWGEGGSVEKMKWQLSKKVMCQEKSENSERIKETEEKNKEMKENM